MLKLRQALATAALGGALCSAAAVWAQAAPAGAPAPVTLGPEQVSAAGIRTQRVNRTDAAAAQALELSGTVVLPPQAQLVVSAPLAGVVQQVTVSPGQALRAGQPVARLQSADLLQWQRERLSAQNQLQLAEARLVRDEKLFAEGLIAEMRVQEARSQAELARLALAERRAVLKVVGAGTQGDGLQAGLTVSAPVAATVIEVLASPGQRLDAGMPVARLARAGTLALELQAQPEQAANVRVGDRFEILGCRRADGSPVTARLMALNPQLTPGNQAVVLRADVEGTAPECLRANQFVQARRTALGGRAASALALPAEAVVRQGTQAYVFVRTAKGFVPTPVQVQAQGAGLVQVTAGLRGDEEVVVHGTAALKGAWQGLGAEEAK